ncbi:hypothetical protein HMPREF6123_2259 [Oribacterium sinus F0268]|uniref:Uncharacterized protein n=1 Tax=Oribacterium sinus F0268 TaxID=585501 RepID=C2L0J0_9FIRM|nr:hypothetical protein HMPREF6123_2259 [Oribacterium sinus F0268]
MQYTKFFVFAINKKISHPQKGMRDSISACASFAKQEMRIYGLWGNG